MISACAQALDPGVLAIATMRFVGAPVDAHAQAQTGIIVGRVTDARSGDAGRGSDASGRRHAPRRASPVRTAGIASSNVPAGTRSIVGRAASAIRRIGRRSPSRPAPRSRTTSRCTPSAVALDQIVVTGTAGETERRSVGNAVSTIDAVDRDGEVSAPDIANLLNGRARRASTFEPISGRLGAGPSIQIRGPSSIGLDEQSARSTSTAFASTTRPDSGRPASRAVSARRAPRSRAG